MKTAIFTRNEELVRHLSYHLSPLAFQIQFYNDITNVLDILKDELDLIIFDISHFPRHWKPFVRLLRDEKNKEQAIVVLIKASQMPFEEAAKAIYLGVNGIIEYDENDKHEIFRLTEIFKRYRSMKDNRHFVRVIPDPSEIYYILFTNPHTGKIVTGDVVNISIQGIMVHPLKPDMAAGLKKGDIIPRCSLQIGDHIISAECRVARPGEAIGFEFTYFNDDAHHRLFTYLMDRPTRKLKERIYPSK